MKTFLVIIVSVAVTWFVASVVHTIQTGTGALWLVSAVKAPGRMALGEIQVDMNAGRYDLAKAKIDVLMDTWQRWYSGPDSNRGLGIGDIMVAFSKFDTNSIVAHPEPSGVTNRSHP